MKNVLGEKIKELCIRENLNQAELADIMGVTPGAVSCWCSGTSFPSKGFIVKLANLFNVDVSEFAPSKYDPMPFRRAFARNFKAGAFPSRLRALMGNLSRVALAEATGIDPWCLKGYLDGKNFPSEDSLLKLSSYFAVPVGYLLAENLKTCAVSGDVPDETPEESVADDVPEEKVVEKPSFSSLKELFTLSDEIVSLLKEARSKIESEPNSLYDWNTFTDYLKKEMM